MRGRKPRPGSNPNAPTPSGYVQQSPWLSIANKQMELMGKYMTELGLTPVARTRLPADPARTEEPLKVYRVVFQGAEDDADSELTAASANDHSSTLKPN